jgi:hypothetical protein
MDVKTGFVKDVGKLYNIIERNSVDADKSGLGRCPKAKLNAIVCI